MTDTIADTMLRGSTRSLLRRSHVTLGGTGAYANQLAAVVGYNEQKQRWVCELINPHFGRRRVLMRDDLMRFEGYFANEVEFLQGAPPQVQIIEAGTAMQGKALIARQPIASGGTVTCERPFMLARRTVKGGVRTAYSVGVPAWKIFYAALQVRGPALAAFEQLGGGEGLVSRLLPDAQKIFDEFAGRLPAEQRRALAERREGEAQRIARVLAAWQANAFAFSLRGEQEDVAAVYHLAMKMLHSCEPNCESKALPTGELAVIASRDIRLGEYLTWDYTGGEASALGSVAARRALLRRRGFECECPRCEREASKRPQGAPACTACAQPLPTLWVFEPADRQRLLTVDPCGLVSCVGVE